MPSKRDSDKVGSARPENVAGPGRGDPSTGLEAGSGGVGGGGRPCVFCCCALRSVTPHEQSFRGGCKTLPEEFVATTNGG